MTCLMQVAERPFFMVFEFEYIPCYTFKKSGRRGEFQ